MQKKYLIIENGNYENLSTEELDEVIYDLNLKLTKLIEMQNATDFSIIIAKPLDLCFAEVPLLLKNTYSNITLECILPYEHIADDWTENDRNMFFNILEKCDYEKIFQKHPSDDCMVKLINSLFLNYIV